MKYYIIAGEASGDLHASNLMKALRANDPYADFRFWGGDRMKAVGGELVKHYRDLAFMGFLEVVQNLNTILSNLKFCKQDIPDYNPDALILVDYPGFNLRIADFARQQKIKVFYYISPQLWAWKRNRVKIVKRAVDKMFVILPFEKNFYSEYDVDVDFVGHPLLDALENYQFADKNEFIQKNKLDGRPVIALLPGSRKQEVSTMLSIMMKMAHAFRDYQFVTGAAPSLDDKFYHNILKNSDIKLASDQTYDLLKNAEAAMVTSGTATLETALIGTPEVVCYKGNFISYQIAKRLVHVDYISLVNLIMEKEIVKELIQNQLNPRNLKKVLDKLLFDNQYKGQLHEDYGRLREKLGGPGASENTAKLILKYLG